jgi:dipeptidyl aminopeptidase/acylaminoacyl peptidase
VTIRVNSWLIFSLCVLCQRLSSQPVTLDYIFQEPRIINPRPSVKFIHPTKPRIYYYADEDYDQKLSLFYYDWNSDLTYKFPDTTNTPSEFQILPNGELLMIMDGDLFISKNFSGTDEFTKDARLTNTNEYEYSPLVVIPAQAGSPATQNEDIFVLYRRSGNYFLRRLDTTMKVELQLTKDESDTISYQLLDFITPSPSGRDGVGLLFARYDNSKEETFLFPNFTQEKVTIDKQRRGISEVRFMKYEVRIKGDSANLSVDTVKTSDSVRFSVQYGLLASEGKKIIFDAETLDRQTRKIFVHDFTRKTIHEIYSDSESAWFERHGNPTIAADSIIIFESEVSGYNSLYRIGIDGSGFTKIAGGDFTILESVYDLRNQKIFYVANEVNPTEWKLYETDFDGSYVKMISDTPGGYQNLHLAQGILVFSHSTITKPDELFISDLSGSPKQITNTISPKFSGINWKIPELITFNNEEDGTKIYAYLYEPVTRNGVSPQGVLSEGIYDRTSERSEKNFRYPLICFAHGGGYWQNVTAGFGPYQDNFMVNTFLTSQGFMILDVDFRGSLGYGSEFRNKTHKNLGYWEVSDYISGINYLDQLGLIDRNKVGIYGGSYGGFISLMAAFRHPEYFKTAVALRPVSDWKNYLSSNWWFTLARLGNYEDNKLAYQISSPITYAAGLNIPLLITHGMLDDNVFLQQTVLLTQKLIEEKKDFELMYYPKEYHSFHLQSSWLDQYKRIFNFFKTHL